MPGALITNCGQETSPDQTQAGISPVISHKVIALILIGQEPGSCDSLKRNSTNIK